MFVFNVTTFEVLWATTFKRQFIFSEKLFFKEEVLCDNSWSFPAINCYQNELHLRSGVVTGSSSDCEWISPYNFVKDLCLCLYYHVKLCIWFVWIYTIHLCFSPLILFLAASEALLQSEMRVTRHEILTNIEWTVAN